jgi:hypothetical protein
MRHPRAAFGVTHFKGPGQAGVALALPVRANRAASDMNLLEN